MPPFRSGHVTLVCALLLCTGSISLTAQSSGSNQGGENFQALAQAANAARDAGKADEATGDYRRALAMRPDWAEGWWNLGTMQYATNRYDDAVASLEKLVSLSPSMAPAWSMLGLSQFEKKDYDASLASLEKAEKLGGNDDPEITRVSAYHLALLLIRSGEFERGAEVLRSAFGAPIPAQAKIALGLALLRVPLLPTEVNPSQEALVHAAGEAAASADEAQALESLVDQYPQTPWLHYSYALALDRAGRTKQALAQQQVEAKISSASPLPWIETSKLELELKLPQEALSAAKRAVALDAESPYAHASLAEALTATGNEQGATEEAHEAEKIRQGHPSRDARMIAMYGTGAGSGSATSDDSATWRAAMQDFSANRYPETVSALKGWVGRHPNDGTAWAVMGLSEFALKDFDNARIHLQRGIDLGLKGNPESVQLANNQLALLMIRDGQFDEATTMLKPFAGHPPLADQTRVALGLALLHMQLLPDDLSTEQRDVAENAGAIVQMLLASRYAEAFPAFQKLIAEYPSTPWLHYAYGGALVSLSQYDDAKTQMEAELKLSPHSALPWIRLASIAVQQHLPADALKAAQSAVALAPQSAEARYELGRAWLENGDAQKAIDELQKANTLKPGNPEIHFVLARAYAKANEPEKAAAERTEFMRLKSLASEKAQGAEEGGSVQKTSPP